MARFDVLNIRPAEIGIHPTLQGVSGISGELGDRVLEIVQLDSELKELMWEVGDNPDSLEDIHDACRAGYMYGWLSLRVYDAIRREVFGDFHEDPDKDWVHPLIQCMYVWHECQYRELLGMPSALGDGTLEKLEVSAFGNIVLDGTKNPLWEWEQRFERKWGEPRPSDSLSEILSRPDPRSATEEERNGT